MDIDLFPQFCQWRTFYGKGIVIVSLANMWAGFNFLIWSLYVPGAFCCFCKTAPRLGASRGCSTVSGLRGTEQSLLPFGSCYEEALPASDVRMVTILQDGIGFVVHEYSVNSLAPLTFVKLTSCSQVNYLVATKAKPQKVQTKLPFGLKLPRRKRKPKKDAKIGGEVKRQRGAQGPLNSVRDQIKASTTGQDLETLFGVADSDSEPDSYSSSSSSSSGESDSEGSGNDGPKEVVLEGSAAQEHSELDTLFCNHGPAASSSGNVASSSSHVPGPAATSRSFCNKHLGLVATGIQVSAKQATCRQCLQKIGRGQPRFGFAFSRIKFHSWLHEGCTVAHLRQEAADLTQASDFLHQQLGQLEEDSQLILAPAIQRVIQALGVEEQAT